MDIFKLHSASRETVVYGGRPKVVFLARRASPPRNTRRPAKRAVRRRFSIRVTTHTLNKTCLRGPCAGNGISSCVATYVRVNFSLVFRATKQTPCGANVLPYVFARGAAKEVWPRNDAIIWTCVRCTVIDFFQQN